MDGPRRDVKPRCKPGYLNLSPFCGCVNAILLSSENEVDRYSLERQ